LIMESIGKDKDLDGRTVNQGITVLGNKGSTDQHSYIQQLRDGLNDFFAMFIEVLIDQNGPSRFVEPNITSGDYLSGFLLGTRQALHETGRNSVCITVNESSPFTIGVLIALFERTVGFYASLVNINAYHQPGVEAGKRAATNILALQGRVLNFLRTNRGQQFTATAIASAINSQEDVEHIFKICQRLSINSSRQISRMKSSNCFEARFSSQ
jgi:glucose-6-phosphate isomerase